MRITWIQPEDLVRHELVQSAAEGQDVRAIEDRWVAAGGLLGSPTAGASEPGPPQLVELARTLLLELAALPAPSSASEPDALEAIEAACPAGPPLPGVPSRSELADRLHGAWLGRAVGCLLGKPVEKIPRRGIREILESTGRWPLSGYFTPRDCPTRWLCAGPGIARAGPPASPR